jgi:hypothetical protein
MTSTGWNCPCLTAACGARPHSRAMSYRKRVALVSFEGDLLRQRHIANDKAAIPKEHHLQTCCPVWLSSWTFVWVLWCIR